MKVLSIGWFLAFVLVVSSCTKEDFHSELYEINTQDIEKDIRDIQEKLITHQEGWILEYIPFEDMDTVYIKMKFVDKEAYTYQVNREEYFEEQESSYGLAGEFVPEIYFEEQSIWGALKQEFHAASKFNILQDGDQILFRRSDGFDGKKFRLYPLTPEKENLFKAVVNREKDRIERDRHLIEAQEENRQKLKKVAEIKQVYFKNLSLAAQALAAFEIDTNTHTIDLTWVDNGKVKNGKAEYEITPWSAKFVSPISINGVSIDSLILGEYDEQENTLSLLDGDGADIGFMGLDNKPGAVYPTANEYLFRLNEPTYKMRWQYVLADDEDGVGPDLTEEHEKILNIGMSFGGYNIFVNNQPNGHNRYGFTVTMDGKAHYMWYENIDEQPDKSLLISQSNSVPESSLGNGNFNNLPADQKQKTKDVYEKLFAGGVFVVPNGRASNGKQSVRIINKNNPNIYLTFKWIPNASFPEPNDFID